MAEDSNWFAKTLFGFLGLCGAGLVSTAPRAILKSVDDFGEVAVRQADAFASGERSMVRELESTGSTSQQRWVPSVAFEHEVPFGAVEDAEKRAANLGANEAAEESFLSKVGQEVGEFSKDVAESVIEECITGGCSPAEEYDSDDSIDSELQEVLDDLSTTIEEHQVTTSSTGEL